MASIDERDLPQHMTILGRLFIVGHAVFLVLGLFAFALRLGIGAASGDAEARPILATVGTAAGLFLAVLGLSGGSTATGYSPTSPGRGPSRWCWGARTWPTSRSARSPAALWVLLPERTRVYFVAPA